MTTIVEFRPRRKEADAAFARPADASSLAFAALPSGAACGAEIILMPLNWLTRIRQQPPRKPMKRRFALREMEPA